MAISGIALAAFAAAQAAAPNSGAKWVPLQSAPGRAAPATVAPAAPQAVILSAPSDNVLRAGTEVPLQLEQTLDSNDKSITEGEQFHLAVANDVMLGNMVVIPAGSPATGEITEIKHKGMWGKSGRIVGRILNVRVGGRLIRLTGNFDTKGSTGTTGVVASAVFVPIAGFFVTGTSAKIPAGAGIRAFLDEDLTVAAPQAGPAAAPAAAPVQIVPAAPQPVSSVPVAAKPN